VGLREATVTAEILMRLMNDAPYVEAALRSALEQDYLGTIVSVYIDGATTDGTEYAVREFLRRHPRRLSAHVARHPHLWLSEATRLALHEATGDDLFFLDGDCRLDPNRVSAHIALHPDATGVCCTQIRFEDEGGKPMSKVLYCPPDITVDQLLRGNVIDTHSLRLKGEYVRNRLLPLTDGLDFAKEVHDDWLWCLIAAFDGKLCIHPERVLATYRYRPDSLTRRSTPPQTRENTVKLFDQVLERITQGA
jgi:glycosyltransferase involved in cell wall biosynthesis